MFMSYFGRFETTNITAAKPALQTMNGTTNSFWNTSSILAYTLQAPLYSIATSREMDVLLEVHSLIIISLSMLEAFSSSFSSPQLHVLSQSL